MWDRKLMARHNLLLKIRKVNRKSSKLHREISPDAKIKADDTCKQIKFAKLLSQLLVLAPAYFQLPRLLKKNFSRLSIETVELSP